MSEIVKEQYTPDSLMIEPIPLSIIFANQPIFREEQETQDFEFTEFKINKQEVYRKRNVEGVLIRNVYTPQINI